MKLKILGAKCTRCEQLHVNALTAVRRQKSLGPIEVETILDRDEIMKFDVKSVPSLVIDDVVVSRGDLLSVDQIEKEIKKRLEK